ncbi:hypothetical protein Rifp1Sym_ca00010 [endosymbiont of Riftia pachyptila (vent Ph05)]|uniref:Transposase n=1 Tax=endosymbiont of Riftia pachyptila (vent Ph05) TaxID=1048808 RepID=G2DEG1_9GAMM|nr:hypothetical protein Rifp1Sym_ca00010 [endosymbiont of Riftia pachyptila (vent Ph05)]
MRRLMKQQALEAWSQRKFKATTHSNHGLPVAPRHLNLEFQVEAPDGVCAGDITYIRTKEPLIKSGRSRL